MWNDWLSSLTGPSGDVTDTEIQEPVETPRRFSNPHSIEKLQSLQTQHQQLQVHQLHLLNQQFRVLKELSDSGESTCTDGGSSAPQSPNNGVSSVLAEAFKSTAGESVPSHAVPKGSSKQKMKIEPVDDDDKLCSSVETSDTLASEVWQQFHAIQAQQWAQALNQARLAKRSPGGVLLGVSGSVMGGTTPMSGQSSGLSGGKRCKAYAAPKGVWKNNGGYNATIYVHKRRIYGPIRRDLSDAIEDRKEMEDALRELTAVHNSPEDAAVLEVEMREVVAGLRNRCTPNGQVPRIGGSSVSVVTPGGETSGRKRLRLVGTPNPADTPLQTPHPSPEMTHSSPDLMGMMFAPPIKDEMSLYDDMMMYDNSRTIGYTPNVGPVYGTPMHLPLDENLDMLPEGNIWGSTHF